jgi:hypothetical protein
MDLVYHREGNVPKAGTAFPRCSFAENNRPKGVKKTIHGDDVVHDNRARKFQHRAFESSNGFNPTLGSVNEANAELYLAGVFNAVRVRMFRL